MLTLRETLRLIDELINNGQITSRTLRELLEEKDDIICLLELGIDDGFKD